MLTTFLRFESCTWFAFCWLPRFPIFAFTGSLGTLGIDCTKTIHLGIVMGLNDLRSSLDLSSGTWDTQFVCCVISAAGLNWPIGSFWIWVACWSYLGLGVRFHLWRFPVPSSWAMKFARG